MNRQTRPNRQTRARLCLMMLLQYGVWGVWLPVLARYLQAAPSEGGLGFTPGQIGWILGLASSIGAVTAPLVAGQLADRSFSTQRVLAVLLAAGGVVKIITAYQTSFSAWLWLSVLYSVLYTPTLSLSNSLAFAHMEDGDREFPRVRVWGTIGWIAASWAFPLFWLLSDVRFSWLPPFYVGVEVADATARLVDSLVWSGVLAFGYAVFCLFLPPTPPQKNAKEKLAFAKAFGLFRQRSFAVLVAASLPIAVIHQIYFMQTAPFLSQVLGLADSRIGPAMSIGQFAEIAVMAATGWLLARFGFRRVILIGVFAYVARYAIFGSVFLPTPVIVASQALHGLCYACFFAAAFIHVDRIAEADVRHSAQTVFGIVILGLGPVLAAPVLQMLSRTFTDAAGVLDYSALWYSLSALAALTMVGFGALFRDETAQDEAGG